MAVCLNRLKHRLLLANKTRFERSAILRSLGKKQRYAEDYASLQGTLVLAIYPPVKAASAIHRPREIRQWSRKSECDVAVT